MNLHSPLNGIAAHHCSSSNLMKGATILECEFRMRNIGTEVTGDAARDLLSRISHLDVARAWIADEVGEVLEIIDEALATG